MPQPDPYTLCTRLLYGPGTWFDLCQDAVSDPEALAELRRRLAAGGDAAMAFAIRTSWPGFSRLRRTATGTPGPAASAALAATDVVAALNGAVDPGVLLSGAAAHVRRSNVLPVMSLTGADIDTGGTSPAAAVCRRLAVLTDDAAAADAAAFGQLDLLIRALAGAWPRRRREVQIPVLFDRRSTGGHGTLRLTLLDSGPPGLYPDPRAMLFLVADQHFAQALDVAWRIAGKPIGDRCVVWRLTTDDLPCDEVAGGSLGAAFGVALTDLARRTPTPLRMRRIDRRCAITAGLEPDQRLSRVTGLSNKLEAAVRQRLRVTLAGSSDRETIPEPLMHDLRLRFADDLPAAVRLSRTRLNLAFVIIMIALMVAVSGVTGGVLAAIRASRDAHQREVAAALLPAADSLRAVDPAGALLLEGLATRLDAPGARATLIRDVLGNRFAGTLNGGEDQDACGESQAWFPDSSRVVTERTEAREIVVWNAPERKIEQRIPLPGIPSGCAVAPDGRTIALVVDDRLYLLPAGSATLPETATDIAVQWVHYAPNGMLATMTQGQPVRLWSIAEGRKLRLKASIPTAVAQIQSNLTPVLAFSRDSRLLAFGERERVILADASDPDKPRVTASISASPDSIAISSRGILAIGEWGTIQMWDVRDPGRPVRGLSPAPPGGLSIPTISIAFSPDGEQLVAATNGSSYVWRMTDGGPADVQVLALTNYQVRDVALSPDGETALVLAGRNPTLWRLSALGKPPTLGTLPLDQAVVTGLAAQPGSNRLVVTTADDGASLWDITDPGHPRRGGATGPTGDKLWSTVFDSTATHFAASSEGGGIGVWTVDTGGRFQRTGEIPATGVDGLKPLAMSPNGALLAVVASKDSAPSPSAAPLVSLWDIRGEPRQVSMLPPSFPPRIGAFAPDGHTLVSVVDTIVTWWNLTDPARPVIQATRSLPADSDSPGVVVFAPNGRRMFLTGNSAPGTVWDLSDPRSPALLATVRADSGAITGRGLLTGPALILTTLGAISIWDVADPQAVSRATAFASEDHNAIGSGGAALTVDGLLAVTHTAGIKGLYTGAALIRLRNLQPALDVIADPVASACRTVGHDLSPQNWSKYAPGLRSRPLCD